MHLARTLVVSSFVLLSSVMPTDVVLAEEGTQTIDFECKVPLVGSVRCGSPNTNVRLGGLKRIRVTLSNLPSESCVYVTVHHAVEDEELRTSPKICANLIATNLWTNPDDEAVDVFMTAKSKGGDKFTLRGYYTIDKP